MNIPQWLRSSADPESVSLFVKSLATFAILFGVDHTVVDQAGGQLTNLIVGVGMAASAVTALWGIVRKIRYGRWSARASDTFSRD